MSPFLLSFTLNYVILRFFSAEDIIVLVILTQIIKHWIKRWFLIVIDIPGY